MLISVQLFVQGDRLQPKVITSMLGVEPQTAYALGDTWTSPHGKVYVKSVGLWKWGVVVGATTANLSDVVLKFCEKLRHATDVVAQLPEAEQVWIDVFVCHETTTVESTEINFSLSPAALSALNAFGLPVEFSANFVADAAAKAEHESAGSAAPGG